MSKFTVGKIYKARLRINNGHSIKKHDIIFKVIQNPWNVPPSLWLRIVRFIDVHIFKKKYEKSPYLYMKIIKMPKDLHFWNYNFKNDNITYLHPEELTRVEELKNAELLYDGD